MMVSLRMTTKAATSRVPMILRDCAGRAVAEACDGEAVVTMSTATFSDWASGRGLDIES